MARVVKKAEVRRSEILATASRLFIRDGYDATTVNAILQELRLSKGAFYHHFRSKEEVMQALARQMAEEMRKKLEPLVTRRDLPALAKLNLLFGQGAQYKREHAPMMRAIVDIYYKEENLRLRTRIISESIAIVGPLYAQILDDGMREGSFAIENPEETASLLIHMGTFLHDAFGDAWKHAAHDLEGAVRQYLRRVDTYARAMENILGIPKRSIQLMDAETTTLFLQFGRP